MNETRNETRNETVNGTMSETVMGVIRSRRSVRAFKKDAVPAGLAGQLLEAARWAPCGGNLQLWRFCVVDEPRVIDQISAFSPGLMGAPPLLFILCTDKQQALEKGGELFRDVVSVMDISMAAQNIMLLAAANGLGTCAVKSFNPVGVARILKLPQGIVPELIVTAGYPADDSASSTRKPIAEIAFHNAWNETA
jgi:nitroreductase